MSHLTNVRESNSGGFIIPTQVDNIKFERESPTYRLLVVPPTGANEIKLNNATIDSYIEITSNVFNLSRSYLEYNVNIPLLAASCNYAYKNKPNIQSLNLYTKSGINIVQIDYLNKMIWMIGRKNMKFNDYICKQGISCTNPIRGQNLNKLGAFGTGAVGVWTDGSLPVLNAAPAANVVIASANAGQSTDGKAVNLLTTNSFNQANTNAVAKRPDGSLVSDIFVENQYLLSGGVGEKKVADGAFPGAALAYGVRFPLCDVADTLLSLDKDLYLKENLIMKISWEPQQFAGFTTTSVTDPVTGAAALVGGYTISGIQLRLAVQTNPNVIKSVMAAVDAGLSIDIPFVTLMRNPVGALATHNVNVKINNGMGRSLIKVIHSFFNDTESKNTAFDNSNLNPADSTVPLRMKNYYTQLNSQRLSDYNLNCTTGDGNGDDYQWNLPYIKNSAIFNADVYRANFFHEDNFCGVNNDSGYKEDQITNPGLPITNEFTWYFFGNAQGTPSLIHHTLIVTRRTLTISPMGVQLQ